MKLNTVDRLRLSKYMVTQYMAHGQGDALERFFQSRQRSWEGIQVPTIRKGLWRLVGREWRITNPDEHFSFDLSSEYQARLVRRVKLFRAKWDELVTHRVIELEGRQYVAYPEGLVEV